MCIDTFSRFVWISELAPMPLDAGPTATAHWDAFWPILQDIRTQLGGTNADLKGLQVQLDNGNENLGRLELRVESPAPRSLYAPSHFTIQKYKDFFDCAAPTPGYPESPEFVRPQSFRHSNAQGLFEPAQRDATWHPIMENYCPTVTVA